MISASPHLYRHEAKKKGIPPEIVQRAIDQSAKPETDGLPAILTLRHLAHLSGANYKYIREIVTRKIDPYRVFNIQKRSGGQRVIAAPEPQLAALQRWIVDTILRSREVSPMSFAYAPGSSPVICARRHLGAKWLVKVDIHDFFESISERRAYFVFRDCGYQPLVSLELARICTRISTGVSASEERWQVNSKRQADGIAAYSNHRMGHLPQGAPTSPLLSNLVSLAVDQSVSKLAERYKLTYTRYSDDLTFSTGQHFTRAAAQEFLFDLERLLESYGHSVHRKKTKIVPPGGRKIVLGLLVDDDHLKLPSNIRRRIADHVRGIENLVLQHTQSTAISYRCGGW